MQPTEAVMETITRYELTGALDTTLTTAAQFDNPFSSNGAARSMTS